MKKIFLIFSLIILIPYIIVSLFINIETKKFYFIKDVNVRIKRNENIVEVPLEEYIIGVVSAEMPASFEVEALKAQAVAARSYVLTKMEQNKDLEYDVVDTVSHQVYLNEEELKNKWQNKYDEYSNKIKEAVLDTKGEILTYDGEVIEAFFFSTSSGYTENCEEVFMEALPYLRSVDSHYDQISPAYNSNVTMSLSDFYTNLGLSYNEELNIEVISTTSTGRIRKIKINGTVFTGNQMTAKLKLKSTFFNIEKNGNNITINTKGYGHGVGMSQYGANGMAQVGYTYDSILKHYYSGVEIIKI